MSEYFSEIDRYFDVRIFWWYFVAPSGSNFQIYDNGNSGEVSETNFFVSGNDIDFNDFEQTATLTAVYSGDNCEESAGGNCTSEQTVQRILTDDQYKAIDITEPLQPGEPENIVAGDDNSQTNGISVVITGEGGAKGGWGFIVGPGSGQQRRH